MGIDSLSNTLVITSFVHLREDAKDPIANAAVAILFSFVVGRLLMYSLFD
jgi:hypothetical protein